MLPARGAGSVGWLVGDGGLVLTTTDQRPHLESLPSEKLPNIAAGNLDFRALAALGERVWIAGAPGTCVLHSADGGKSWRTLPHGANRPAARPSRSSTNTAAGQSGRSARSCTRATAARPGASSTAAASGWPCSASSAEPERVPLELLALQSGSDAYLSAIEILGCRDDDLTAPRRTHAAVLAAGASHADAAWQFPLRDPGLPQTAESILAHWNALHGGRAIERMEEHLVRRIRQWQPDVIVTEDVSPRGDNPLAHLTNQVTLAAVQKAADLTAYSDQVTLAGLAPWKVKKVLTLLPEGKQGLINITPAQWAPRLGRSLADVAEGGRGLILDDVSPSPRNVGLSLLVDHLPQETGRRDVMSGIVAQSRQRGSATPGQSTGRRSGAAQPAGPEAAQRRAAAGPHRRRRREPRQLARPGR